MGSYNAFHRLIHKGDPVCKTRDFRPGVRVNVDVVPEAHVVVNGLIFKPSLKAKFRVLLSEILDCVISFFLLQELEYIFQGRL